MTHRNRVTSDQRRLTGTLTSHSMYCQPPSNSLHRRLTEYFVASILNTGASHTQENMALLQRIQDGNYLESSANTDYNKSSEYFVFQLFIENLILIKYPWAGIHG